MRFTRDVIVNGIHRYVRPSMEKADIPGVVPMITEVEEFVVEARNRDGSFAVSFIVDDPQGYTPGSVYEVEIRPSNA